MIEFEGQLQEEEFRRAQWASTPAFLRWFGWLILACVVMVFATGGLQSLRADPLADGIKLAAGIGFGLFMIIAPRRAITKVWRNTPLLHEPTSGHLSEAGIKWKTTSTDSTLTWDKITRRHTTDDLILLYTSARQALILPRSYFKSDGEWDAAKTLAARS